MITIYISFIIMLLCSYPYKKTLKNSNRFILFLLKLLPAILVIALLLGCRFGWATDYPLYLRSFQLNDYEGFEPLFKLLHIILHYFNALFPIFFFLCSFLCFLGFTRLLYRFKEIAYITFPLFIWIIFFDVSNLIRFTTALFFVFQSLACIDFDFSKRNWKKIVLFFIFAVCSMLTHSGTTILLLIILLSYRISAFDNYKIALVVFIISCFLNGTMFIEYMMDFVTYLSERIDLGTLNTSRYMEDSTITEKYFGELRYGTFFNQGQPNLVMASLILYVCIILCGNVVLKKVDSLIYRYIYRIVVCAIILTIPCYGIELMMRMTSVLFSLSSIIIGYSIFFFHKVRRTDFRIGVCLMIFSYIDIYLYIKIFGQLNGGFNLLYIWDL